MIWNGPAGMDLGTGGEACSGSNPTCNEAQVRRTCAALPGCQMAWVLLPPSPAAPGCGGLLAAPHPAPHLALSLLAHLARSCGETTHSTPFDPTST